MCRKPDAHVSIAAFRNDADLEVVQPTSGRDWVRRAHARCVFVGFAMSCAIIYDQFCIDIDQIQGAYICVEQCCDHILRFQFHRLQGINFL